MEERKFKKITMIGLEFYVDYFASGEIICIKEVHSGRRFMTDDIFVGKKPIKDLFLEALGFAKEEKVTPDEKETRKRNTK